MSNLILIQSPAIKLNARAGSSVTHLLSFPVYTLIAGFLVTANTSFSQMIKLIDAGATRETKKLYSNLHKIIVV